MADFFNFILNKYISHRNTDNLSEPLSAMTKGMIRHHKCLDTTKSLLFRHWSMEGKKQLFC